MIELKKCPFCGGEVQMMAIAGEPFPPTYEVELDKITSDSDDICYIHCPTCGVNWHKEVRIESFPLDTIKAWNTRKPVDKVIGQIQELANEFQEGFYHEVHCKNREDNCEWKDCCSCALERAIEIIKQEMM